MTRMDVKNENSSHLNARPETAANADNASACRTNHLQKISCSAATVAGISLN